MSKDYNDYREWNAEYFVRRAMTVGSNTVDAIKCILTSRKLEVQTYRMCLGVLGFAAKYGKTAQEECCRQAIAAGRVKYTYIKNSIQAVSEDIASPSMLSKRNEERNKGAFVMGTGAMDVNSLLSKSQRLVQDKRKGAEG